MRTFNKRDDDGETSLLFDRRVSKSDLRCEAYGTIDEAVSALGITLNFVTKDKVKEVILKVQKELFKVNAELATKPEDYERLASSFTPITNKMADEHKGTNPFDKEPVSNDDLLMEYETKGFETFSQIANEQGLDAGIAYRDKMEQLKARRNYAK